MPWTQKQMLRDANGDLIPQYWDVVEQEFKPLTGRDGANDVRLTGSNVELIFTRAQTLVPSGVNMGVSSAINVSKYKYVFIQFAPGGSAGLNQYKLHIRTFRGDTTSAFRQITVLDGQSGSNNETDFINVKSLNIAVYVENLTSEDRTFDYIHLFGVRA